MSDYVNIYECPEGCKAQGGKPIAATIRGWKKHMTHAHGQWTDEQLAAIVGASTTTPEDGKAQFLAESEGTTTLESVEPEGKEEKPKKDGEAKKPAPEEIAYIPLRSKKLRKFFGGLIGKFVSESNVELDADDQGMIDEAFDQLEELFPIVFAVPKKQMVIESRIAAVAVPLSGLALVYIKHSLSWQWIKSLFKKDDDGNPPEDQQTQP
jgi:hypothetical protein